MDGRGSGEPGSRRRLSRQWSHSHCCASPSWTHDQNARIRKHTGDKRVRLSHIGRTTVFRPDIRLADRYRTGRVFIAGAAAHVHLPAGAPDSLLDTYEAERQPITAGVLGLSTKKYEGLAELDPSSIKRGDDDPG
ncbi:FAD-dependent monooxygenase [Nocardia sp. NPDC047654]|uniref:FAD-dependent monooxygenase n=1 Tax=Nocardia sp. NPDC047654 TaxID=3364314 RepID=UPI003713C05A